MAIKFAGARQVFTDTNAVVWDNQSQASLHFFFRYELLGGVSAAVLNTYYVFSRGLGSFDFYTQATGASNTMNLTANVQNVANAAAHRGSVFNVGTVNHVAVTYDQGQQILWINGAGIPFGTLTGNTKNYPGGNPVVFGTGTASATAQLLYTFGQPWLWNGYILTPTDVVNLRDGADPSTIGTGATWRGGWSLHGTTGATVTVGDSGLANLMGDAAYDLRHTQGAGAAVYVPDLVFVPSAAASPRVTTEGKMVAFPFHVIADSSPTMPSAIVTLPTAKVNGTSVGSLVAPCCNGYQLVPLAALPTGTVVVPGDVVTLSAPRGWATTAAGIALEMTDQAVTNLAGVSDTGVDSLVKTLKPGWNHGHPPGFENVGSMLKNLMLRCDTFGFAPIVTYDATGKPISAATLTTIGSYFYKVGPQSTIDKTINAWTGLYAIGWDDTLPGTPTTLGIITDSPLILSVTERLDLYNPGALVGGIRVGMVRVFQVTQIATTPQDGGSNAFAALKATINNATKTFHFANAVVYGPGEFPYTDNVPVVLDRSDPYAPSKVYLDRMMNGAGSCRGVDHCFSYAGIAQSSEDEHLNHAGDFTYGLWQGKVDKSVYWTLARPWDPSVTPYFYTTTFGTPFNATLAAPIADATTTVLNISDAATAPVLIGLRLLVDSELMRVLDVSGTAVTVERGACGTTATSHSAGTIQVQNRWLAAVPSGHCYELVAPGQHGITTGQQLKCYNGWPTFTFSDGVVANETNFQPVLCVTGANTAVHILGGGVTPRSTIVTSYAFSGTARSGASWPETPQMPVEVFARLVGRVGGASIHINLPHPASDSLIRAIAKRVRDNFPAGSVVYVEFSNEPWNDLFANKATFTAFSNWLYPSTHYGWEYYVRRAVDSWKIFHDVFAETGRGGEIVGLINSNKFDAGGVALKGAFIEGLGNTVPWDVAIAIYTGADSSPASQKAFLQYDDDQAVTQYRHNLRYNRGSQGYQGVFDAMNGVISSYNATYGRSTKLYGYEGGVGLAAPKIDATLASGVSSGATSFTLNSWRDSFGASHLADTALVAGTPMLIGSEWVVTGTPAGNVVPVTRAQFGTAAAAYSAGATIRTAYYERSRDMVFNPNWHAAEYDLYAMCQLNGVDRINQYALFIPASDGPDFPAYRQQGMDHGRGDGTDGKFDNRTMLCCPGRTGSKSPTDNPDAVRVSVRGQAFLDWMAVDETGGVRHGGEAAVGGGVLVVAASGGMRRGGGAHFSSIVYDIYANDGMGGPVNYIAAVASVDRLEWTSGALAFPGDYTFHVRAMDLETGLEEHNADARVRVILDETGADVTGRPAPPTGLGATPLKGGGIRVMWSYRTPSGRAKPSEYRVYGETPTVDYSTPLAVIAYTTDGRPYVDLDGLAAGVPYEFGVRARNVVAEERNTVVVTATPLATGPSPPDGLTGSVI